MAAYSISVRIPALASTRRAATAARLGTTAIFESEARLFLVVEQIFKEANRQETPRITGRLQRSFSIRRASGNRYILRWRAPYASFVQFRGRSRGFADRVRRRGLQLAGRRSAR